MQILNKGNFQVIGLGAMVARLFVIITLALMISSCSTLQDATDALKDGISSAVDATNNFLKPKDDPCKYWNHYKTNGYSDVYNFWKNDATPEFVESCIADGKRVNGWPLESALHLAASYSNDPAVVQLLIDKGANVTEVNAQGYTPLQASVITNQGDSVSKIIELLISNGANLNTIVDEKYTLLHLAAWKNKSVFVFEGLVDNGLDINTTTSQGEPLNTAAGNNTADVVQKLIDLGADINTRDSYNDTPVQSAAMFNTIDVVQKLIDHGADVDTRNSNGDSAMDCVFNLNETQSVISRNLDALIEGSLTIELGESESPAIYQQIKSSLGNTMDSEMSKRIFWNLLPFLKSNDSEAQYMLGKLIEEPNFSFSWCSYGEEWAGKYEEAEYWYQKATDQDHSSAMNALGKFYRNIGMLSRDIEMLYRTGSDGVSKNTVFTKSFYRSAFMVPYQNYALVDPITDEVYYQDLEIFDWDIEVLLNRKSNAGRNIDRSRADLFHRQAESFYKQSVPLFRKAALKGHAVAQANLAAMLANGERVSQDYQAAFVWYSISMKNGNKVVRKARNLVEMELTTRQTEEAEEFVKACLDSKYRDCI